MLETTTGLANAVLTTRKGDITHQRQQIKKWITTNGFANSIQQTDSESEILQLGDHVARDLGLRFRSGPPHSHQSNGAIERLHRTLFDELRAVRLQWSHNLGIQPDRHYHNKHYHGCYNTVSSSSTSTWHNCTPEQLPQALQQSDLSMWRICSCGYAIPCQLQAETKECRPKIRGIWIGKDPTADEHLIALPSMYDSHPFGDGFYLQVQRSYSTT